MSYLAEQSQPDKGRWFWAYHIRIENDREEVVQLLARRWQITDGRGAVHMVEGEGVVGEQPHIDPGEEYQYTSGAVIETPLGTMQGHYEMVDVDGNVFRVAIPVFRLAVTTLIH